ncbi:hypothetical protein B0H19DRAFT_1211594 [Mycena capillaripes]|nr:hypothetical protein B0H19DRAFT_1211594 [Mycena capillaripes]
MIARCRAKCWIIQLKEEGDYSTPITQRGVRGHVIVYPQRPSDIAKVLPPSIDEIVTPICVIFVGSNPPTQEWLQKKAKPLTVRKEKVMAALSWLKTHNPLYKNVEINHHVFNGQPDEAILPFHVQHILPSTGIASATSSYIPTPQADEAPKCSDADDLSIEPTAGHASSNELRQAAIKHMNMPGNNYLGIPHEKHPVNEFDNPALFPMIYPTLYPYGIGGCEDKRRQTPLTMKTHIKHLFNLSDRRFQYFATETGFVENKFQGEAKKF